LKSINTSFIFISDEGWSFNRLTPFNASLSSHI